MYKFVLLLSFVVFVGVASYLMDEVGFQLVPESTARIDADIKKDLGEVQKTSLFPKELKQVHQVFVSDHRTKKVEIDWKKLSANHFPQKKDGLFDLQIEVFDDGPNNPVGKDPAVKTEDLVILQFSLFDIKTKNKIWELSRSYKSSDLSQKK